MSESHSTDGSTAELSREEMLSMLFAQLVMQQANMARMLLGQVAHPETGKMVKDLEAARLFIDQLEMLEAKTKGNLNKQEAELLKQSLMSLRLAFVQAVDTSPSTGAPPAEAEAVKSTAAEADHHKKFSKKY